MNSYFHDIELPGISIPGNIFLAPVAGFSDAPFRSIAVDMGASMCFTEMVSCEGLTRNGEKTVNLMRRAGNEKYLAIQVFTPDPDTAFRAMPAVLEYEPVIVDLNCGCPVPKVVKNGAGSALMRDLPRLKEIVSAMNEGLRKTAVSPPPVSVKIRSGWDAASLNFLETASAAVDAGAAMVSLHPRTRSQGYSGKACWEHIRELKQSTAVPVIGSGDLFSPEDALSMLETTGCDGLMFSRGAMGNPWIFRQTISLLKTGRAAPPPGDQERSYAAFRHLSLAAAMNGEKKACREMKKQLCSYTRGMKGAAGLRDRIVHASTLDEFRHILEDEQ